MVRACRFAIVASVLVESAVGMQNSGLVINADAGHPHKKKGHKHSKHSNHSNHSNHSLDAKSDLVSTSLHGHEENKSSPDKERKSHRMQTMHTEHLDAASSLFVHPNYWNLHGHRRSRLDPDLHLDETLNNLRTFVASHPPGQARVLFMGDSTMAGLVTSLLDRTEDITQDARLVHVVNDRRDAVNLGVRTSKGGEWHKKRGTDHEVGPHSQWIVEEEEGAEQSEAVQRLVAATAQVHATGCTWGGGVETYDFKTGPLKGLVVHHWSFIPEYSEVCWSKICYRKALQILKPTITVWNVGLHMLNHDFDEETCNKRQVPGLWMCDNYKKLVKKATEDLLSASSHVIWKSTNWLCDQKQMDFQPSVAELMNKWIDPNRVPFLERECHQYCDLLNKAPGVRQCSDWLMMSKTTKRFYAESLHALGHFWKYEDMRNRVHLLDAYSLSKECCGRGCDEESEDGVHYIGLDRTLLWQLSRTLSRIVPVNASSRCN